MASVEINRSSEENAGGEPVRILIKRGEEDIISFVGDAFYFESLEDFKYSIEEFDPKLKPKNPKPSDYVWAVVNSLRGKLGSFRSTVDSAVGLKNANRSPEEIINFIFDQAEAASNF